MCPLSIVRVGCSVMVAMGTTTGKPYRVIKLATIAHRQP
jgi:hypothetical protein